MIIPLKDRVMSGSTVGGSSMSVDSSAFFCMIWGQRDLGLKGPRAMALVQSFDLHLI